MSHEVATTRRIIGGRMARVAAALATPLFAEDYLSLFDPMLASGRPGSGLRARVERVEPEAGGAATLVLRPGHGWAGHLAGQWVRLGVEVDGVLLHRSYSLTAPPREDGLISVTVARHDRGTVSRHLTSRVVAGEVLRLSAASGDFVLPALISRPLLFVSAGSGLTPVMGMLRSLPQGVDAVVVHSARTPEDVLFGAELRALQGIRLVERHTAAQGRLTVEDLTAQVPDWRDRETWACGPTGLLDLNEAHHGGVVHTERFAPVVVAGTSDGRVTLARSGKTADTAGTLLATGEAAGALMPSGCRMGICFGCVVPLTSGRVRDIRTGCETGEPGQLIQTCINAPVGDVVLDA